MVLAPQGKKKGEIMTAKGRLTKKLDQSPFVDINVSYSLRFDIDNLRFDIDNHGQGDAKSKPCGRR